MNTQKNSMPREVTRHRENSRPSVLEHQVENSFAGLFLSCFFNVKDQLKKGGLVLSNNETFALVLIREYLAATGRVTITKREAYEEVIEIYLGFSYITFNRLFNGLVRKHCFNPLGVRGNGRVGLAEAYCLTTVAKRIDAIMKESVRAACIA